MVSATTRPTRFCVPCAFRIIFVSGVIVIVIVVIVIRGIVTGILHGRGWQCTSPSLVYLGHSPENGVHFEEMIGLEDFNRGQFATGFENCKLGVKMALECKSVERICIHDKVTRGQRVIFFWNIHLTMDSNLFQVRREG